MAGIVIAAFSKRTFDFTNLANGASVEYVMIKSLDLSQWTAAQLQVRVHSTNIEPGCDIKVVAYRTAPSIEDPSVDFVYTGTFVSIGVDENTNVPSLDCRAITSVASPAIRLTVLGSQHPSTPASAAAELSAVIVAKAKRAP